MSAPQSTASRPRLPSAKRIVVKVGSTLLSASPAARPAAIADEIAGLRASGVDAVVVSSGAISLGSRVLGLQTRPTELPLLQAAAAVGQGHLLQNWEHGFAAHNITIGQVLLTHGDLSNRTRFLNARHALRALLESGVVAIVNENDTVAVDEIKYGDNDLLAALVANLIGADALVVLTDVDGLHDAPPADGGRRIPVVHDVDTQATPVAGDTSSGGFGSGGMASKVLAAKAAGRHGVTTYVVRGNQVGVIAAALRGDDIGTVFVPSAERLGSRKHWMAYGSKPSGSLIVDTGAHQAVAGSGKSLLPAGVLDVTGEFGRGDIVSLVTAEGVEFARGLAGYAADEMRQLKGLRSAAIQSTLGYKYVDPAIHRDDLALL